MSNTGRAWLFAGIGAAVLALLLGLLIFLNSLGIFDGNLTYVVEDKVYAEYHGVLKKSFGLPKNPEKEGYLFLGWYEDEGTYEKEFKLSNLPSFLGLYLFTDTTAYAKIVEHDHTFQWKTTVAPSCINTGEEIYICTEPRCAIVAETRVMPMINHDIDDAVLIKNEIDGVITYSFNGSCDFCDRVFNNFSIDAIADIKKQVTCLNDGLIEYKCSAPQISFVINEVVAKLPHSLNGKLITEFMTEDGHIIYGTPNAAPYEDSDIQCEVPELGAYVCEVCERHIDNVSIKKLHNYTYTTVTAPTCLNYGTRIANCTDCDLNELQSVDPLGHSVKWRLSRGSDGESFVLTSYCDRAGCNAIISQNTVDERFISIKITKQPSCTETGTRFVEYDDGDVYVTLTEVVKVLPHTINGEFITAFMNEDGSVNYGLEGVHRFANGNIPACTTHSSDEDYYYVCEVCHGLNPIVVYRPHDFAYTVTTPETCLEDGLETGVCTVCVAKDYRVIPAHGHYYNWTLEINDTDDEYDRNESFNLIALCEYCENKNVSVIMKSDPNLSSVITKYPNCHETGLFTYTYRRDVPGYGYADASCTDVIATTGDHVLNGYLAYTLAGEDGVAENIATLPLVTDATRSYKYSIPGIKIFANDGLDLVCSKLSKKLVAGYYECDHGCGKINVAVYIDHTVSDEDFVLDYAPTCCHAGQEYAVCECGDKIYRSIPATGNHTSFDYVLERSGNYFRAVNYCTVGSYKKTVMNNISAANVTKVEHQKMNCVQDGKYYYYYVIDGNKYEMYETIACDPYHHCLNGVFYQDLLDSEGRLSSDIDGVSLPEDYVPILNDVVQGGFICDHCREFIERLVLVVSIDEE